MSFRHQSEMKVAINGVVWRSNLAVDGQNEPLTFVRVWSEITVSPKVAELNNGPLIVPGVILLKMHSMAEPHTTTISLTLARSPVS